MISYRQQRKTFNYLLAIRISKDFLLFTETNLFNFPTFEFNGFLENVFLCCDNLLNRFRIRLSCEGKVNRGSKEMQMRIFSIRFPDRPHIMCQCFEHANLSLFRSRKGWIFIEIMSKHNFLCNLWEFFGAQHERNLRHVSDLAHLISNVDSVALLESVIFLSSRQQLNLFLLDWITGSNNQSHL